MTKSTKASAGVVASAFGLCALTACGGQTKQADSPGVCPEGLTLRGADCVAAERANPAGGESQSAQPSDSVSESAARERKAEERLASAPASRVSQSEAPAEARTPYDRDSVDVELKRGARQIKANCGAATDDEGKAAGPWGKTKASIVLGRNGHVRQVTVPPPYDGKPVGICVVHAFEKIQFPPYSGSSDASVEWDVDLVEPKH